MAPCPRPGDQSTRGRGEPKKRFLAWALLKGNMEIALPLKVVVTGNSLGAGQLRPGGASSSPRSEWGPAPVILTLVNPPIGVCETKLTTR